MQSFTVRIATAGDAEAIARIQHEAWLAVYPNEAVDITQEDIMQKLDPLETREEHWQDRINNSGDSFRTFVVLENDRVIGFCKVEKKAQENDVNALYLDMAYVGKGAGTVAFTEALAWLGDAMPITIDVVSYNMRAITFYERFGFAITGFGEPYAVIDGKSMPMTRMLRLPVRQ